MTRLLNDQDINSATWAKIRTHYEGELASLRKKNDGNINTEETARLRGRIAEVKALLALDKPIEVLQQN